jgi:hypothetical protein
MSAAESPPPLIWWWHVMRTSRKIILVLSITLAVALVTLVIWLAHQHPLTSEMRASVACYHRIYPDQLNQVHQIGLLNVVATDSAHTRSLILCGLDDLDADQIRQLGLVGP